MNFSGSSLTVSTTGYTVTSTSSSRNLVFTGALTLADNVALSFNQNNTNAVWGFGTINFGTGASLTIQGIATANNANRISLSTAGTITGGSVTLAGTAAGVSGFVATANGVTLNTNITNNSTTSATMLGATSGNLLTFGGVLSGTANLQISAGQAGGAGTTVLNNTNTYSGGTYLNSATNGVLRIGVSNALPSGTTVFFGQSAGGGTADTGGSVDLNGLNLTVGALESASSTRGVANNTSTLATLTLGKASGTNTFAGVIGTVTNTNLTTQSNNIALVKTGASTQVLSGANTYTGTTTVSEGTLRAGVASVANTSGAFGLNSNVTLANTSGATLDLNGFNTQIGSLSGGGTSGGNVTLGAGVLSVGGGTTSGSTTTFAGAISGTGGVTKIGSGTQSLSGTNTYTGVTTVSAGTLLFNTTNSLYNNTPASWTDTNIVVNSGGVLALTLGGANGFSSSQVQSVSQLGTAAGGLKNGSYFGIDTSNGDQTYASAITNTNVTNSIGFVKLGANTLTLTGANSYGGGSSDGTRVIGGTLQIGDGGTTGTLGSGNIAISSGATLAFNRSDARTVDSIISGVGGGFDQLGGGTVTFTKANTYSGATNVNAGTLKLSSTGSVNSTPTISVANGAFFDVSSVSSFTLGSTTSQTLQGSGTVTGAVTVASGSTIRGDSGTGTGTLTTGNVTVQNGGRLGVQLGTGTAASNLNAASGVLNLNSGSIIDPNGTFDGAGSRVLATLASGTDKLVVGGTSYNTAGDIATYTYTAGDTGLKPLGALQIDVTGLNLNDGEQLVLSRNNSNQLVISFTPVPEPALMLALCGLVVGGFVGVRKLRRKGQTAEVTPAA